MSIQPELRLDMSSLFASNFAHAQAMPPALTGSDFRVYCEHDIAIHINGAILFNGGFSDSQKRVRKPSSAKFLVLLVATVSDTMARVLLEGAQTRQLAASISRCPMLQRSIALSGQDKWRALHSACIHICIANMGMLKRDGCLRRRCSHNHYNHSMAQDALW